MDETSTLKTKYLLREFKEGLKFLNGDICHVHKLENSTLLRYQYFPKLSYISNSIPIKVPGRLF